jgi:hypothetical protein
MTQEQTFEQGAIAAAASTEAQALPPHTITLDTPILRGSQHVTHVTVRKPTAGELRGVQLVALLQMDVAALSLVLPRITTPLLTKFEVDQLDPADLVQLGTEVSGFLLTKADRQAFPTA